MKTHILQSTRNWLLLVSLNIFMNTGGCYEINYVSQPKAADPNSAFDVKICVVLSEGFEPTDYFMAYGMIGIMIPEGWTVKDAPEWIMPQKDCKGCFKYDADVVSFLQNSESRPPSGYRWWGAKSAEQIDLAYLDSGFVHVTILTDEQTGLFETKFVLGDTEAWHKKKSEDMFGIATRSNALSIETIVSQNTKSFTNGEWEIYPNPTDGKVFIQLGNITDEVTLNICDMNGRHQKSMVLRESQSFVDMSSFSKGTYIFSLMKPEGIQTRKVILQ